MLWHGDHARKLSRATDRQMIEKPTHSSRAGLSCKKADFGEMQKNAAISGRSHPWAVVCKGKGGTEPPKLRSLEGHKAEPATASLGKRGLMD